MLFGVQGLAFLDPRVLQFWDFRDVCEKLSMKQRTGSREGSSTWVLEYAGFKFQLSGFGSSALALECATAWGLGFRDQQPGGVGLRLHDVVQGSGFICSFYIGLRGCRCQLSGLGSLGALGVLSKP